MTSGQFIGYRLNNTAAVTALVSTRIYHGLVPESVTTLPAINYYMISAPNLWGNTERERWQISIRSNDPENAQEIAFEVRNAFNNLQDSINSFDVQNCWYEDKRMIIEEPGIYHIPVDIFVLYVRT